MTPVAAMATTALLREWLTLERRDRRVILHPSERERHSALEAEIDERIPARFNEQG